MRIYRSVLWIICLLGAVTVIGGCGDSATIRLMKTTGEVEIFDDGEKAVPVKENLSLHHGYCLTTKKASYAWMNMDDTKLAKMDSNSNVTVLQEGKHLGVEVNYGNLYFNVTKPLEDDETFEIYNSNMMAGIRGTRGWVEVYDANTMRVNLLKGKVECSVYNDKGELITSATIQAGECADMYYDGVSSGDIYVGYVDYIPAFVDEEPPEPDKNESGFEEQSSMVPDNGAVSGGSDASHGNNAQVIESRAYYFDEEDSQMCLVDIYDDGNWKVVFEGWGASYIEVWYSYAQEEAGEYVEESGYDLGSPQDEYSSFYIGHVRFKMTESELNLLYQDSDYWVTFLRRYD